MPIIAVDAGGTNIKIGLIDKGKIIVRRKLASASHNGFEPQMPLIVEAVSEMLLQSGFDQSDLKGVGSAIPGIVDVKAKKILDINDKYTDLMQLDLPKWVKKNWKAPFVVEGDARSALYGSWKYGAGKGVDDLVLITIGTGIGTGVVIQGNVLYGKHGQAGILGGHFIVDQNGKRCNCGNIGCAEALASSWSLPDLVRALCPSGSSLYEQADEITFQKLFKEAREGEPSAVKVRDHCINTWSALTINMIHAYDPEVVLLSGGVLKSAEDILPEIRWQVKERAWTPWGQVQIEAEELLDDAALLGVEYLLKENYGI